ncbi:MAG: L-glutamate gamma-semialdehyde dehydrogenase [Flavobacteriales bacterium]|jgi:1-pyrroline-5-carboxylate dehydrogenase|nr:L-glutamate gamma-semialdehyde dehydrogenase [Flavobacteriales bacterium]
MSKGVFNVPIASNEPVKSYKTGSKEREELLHTYNKMNNSKIDVPLYIGGQKITTDNKKNITPPHDHQHILGQYSLGEKKHVQMAIDSALEAKSKWSNLPWNHRVAIFLKAAELLAGPYRAKINAATMLAQSKNIYQAEIDAACELIDFFKYNAEYVTNLYSEQPESSEGIWNRLEHRPLEGFVFAITPFNFTSICANLCAAPALMGNVVIWKPAETQVYSAKIIMELFKEAGLPDGVINMVTASGPLVGEVVFNHKDFAGLHFTGSTNVFRQLWKKIGNNIEKYRSYPRIVGETGGKDFIIAHKSANPSEVATGISRGAFEYQGQKCSAASRAYIPSNIWKEVKKQITSDIKSFKMGSPEDPSNFINAVISERSFNKISSYIDYIKKQKDAEIIIGGGYDKTKGYFIDPTVVVTTNPKFRTMCEEVFGPLITIYVYDEKNWIETLKLVDETSEYALTGAVFSVNRYAIDEATKILENAAGNFYINDKPTGAVVGQQPFGGGRGSGTNDKAGSILNLLRWVSPRTIKETFNPAKNYRYPFLEK